MIRRSTWIVLAVFVLLLAALLIFQRVKQQSDDAPLDITPQPESIPLIDIAEDQVVIGLRIEDNDGNVVEVQRDDEESNWVLQVPESDVTDVEKVES